MRIALKTCEIKSWEEADAGSIAPLADNRKVWINLRDGFPHPYSPEDARKFIAMARARVPESFFAIVVDGKAVGGIGYQLHSDVERVSAEIGYWLGEPYWGRGIATEAVRAVTAYAVREHGLTRVYAVPYEWNPASFRVLEKAGFTLEGTMRRSVIKDGKIINQRLYAWVAPGGESGGGKP